ncbi:class I SAM-dependent methyltransferase [Candidatus Saccharibacteria bacterium]|nr:class I SAM-dependent methyltransferase [Candidatus Saccharibacteria bacterium]
MAKNKKTTKTPEVISDYNGYDYKKIFWEDADREYEDRADRLAIRKLLPEHMKNFVDIAGGYGRLADEYLPRADKATLFDYSKTELKQAKEIYGDRLHTKAGDIYDLPFKDGEFSALMMVRATHHFKDMKKVTKELYRILEPGGVAVIEVANKKTLPRMIRYLTGRTKINPFDRSIANLTDISKNGFYNYHPKYMEDIFRKQGFEIDRVLSVSNFRNQHLKNAFKTNTLVRLENGAQSILAPVRFAPSIYYRLIKK